MAYQIECVIQEVELAVNGCVSALKIKGTEGYLLKQGSEEYNVFCPVSDDGKIQCGKPTDLQNAKDVLYLETPNGIDDTAQSLIQAKISNTKVRLKFEEPPSKSKSTADTSGCEKIEAKIISIALI